MADKLILKPCPFCGGEAKIDSRYIGCGSVGLGSHDEYFIKCVVCRATSDEFRDKKQAVDAWNRRAEPQARVLTVEELRGMDGMPVWIESHCGVSKRFRVCDGVRSGKVLFQGLPDSLPIKEYDKTWLAFDRQPVEGVRG